MKAFRYIATAFAVLAAFSSCDLLDMEETDVEVDDTIPILDGNTLTYGDHEYILDESATEGTITFTHFPATKREFEVLRNQLLGFSQPGALALGLMSFEMFRRDRSKGEKCIELCTVSACAKQVINNLKQKFPEHRGDTGDSYCQPYLVASFLVGATTENNYQPDYPYKLKFTYSTSSYAKQGEESLTFGGHVYQWVTTRGGNKDYNATVIQLYDGEVLVHGCANFYLAAPTIDNWEDTLK